MKANTSRLKSGIRNYFRNLFDMRKDTMDHGELREMMWKTRSFTAQICGYRLIKG